MVGDGSTDDGAEVAGQFDDPRIRLIQQENRGVSAARNRGIEASRGELIAFLDADDEWTSQHLEALVRLQEKCPQAGAYGTAYILQESESAARVPAYSAGIPPEPWEGLLSDYCTKRNAGGGGAVGVERERSRVRCVQADPDRMQES